MSEPTPELSTVVLCYRAEEDARRVVTPLYRQLEATGIDFELVLVGNYWAGSEDDTPKVVEDLAREHPRARAITREKRGAMGWDMRSGLDAARGEFLIVMDGDGQNPIEDVLRMYGELKTSGADVMKGRRVKREDGLYRRAISAVYNLAFRLLFGAGALGDINGKPKGFRRAAYERLDLRSDDWFIDAEIVLTARRLGMRIGEIPVVFTDNKARSSFVKPRAIFEFAVNMLRVRFGRR